MDRILVLAQIIHDRPIKADLLSLLGILFIGGRHRSQLPVGKPADGRTQHAGQRDILTGIIDQRQKV